MAFQKPKPGDYRKVILENVNLKSALNEIIQTIQRHNFHHPELQIDFQSALDRFGINYEDGSSSAT